MQRIENIGIRAENHVFTALKTLPSPWQVFPTVEWRLLRGDGEVIGEADVVVFHPHYGLVVFEIKAGAVDVREGEWFYASCRIMKQSPFSQARRNRYALTDKLIQPVGWVEQRETHRSCNEFDGFRYRSTHPTKLFSQGHYQVLISG